ncbi:Protein IRX15-LIKE [Zea mays]|jgi:hypothetical protein|uniref:Protein IRX15-LIKE n=1 Tax=Zea mays TaxID=4577 RepID=A0A1D6DW43_MAIZE|nr:Protein IRX15-LIKE [Zea mays]
MKSMGSRDKLAAASSPRRVLLVVFAFCFAFATFLTFLYTTSHFTTAPGSGSGSIAASTTTTTTTTSGSAGGGGGQGQAGPESVSKRLPVPVFEALVHFASISNATHRMSDTDIRAMSSVLRARAPCNLLVFGLGAESPLWLGAEPRIGSGRVGNGNGSGINGIAKTNGNGNTNGNS